MRRHRGVLIRARLRLAVALLWTLRVSAFALLFVPIALVAVMSFGAESYVTIPPHSWSPRWYINVFRREEFVSAFLTSLGVAAITTPISVLVGTLAAYGLWKRPSAFDRALESVLMAPVLLPLVVTGLAFLVFVSRTGIGTGLPAIVLAHVVVTFPYSFRAMLAALARYDRQLNEAAASVGVRPLATFLRITLPVVRPGLFAAALFAFVMSFDDFATTIFLISPGTRTLPIAIYQYLEFNLDPTVSAVCVLLVIAAIGVVLLIERTIGMDRFLGLRAN